MAVPATLIKWFQSAYPTLQFEPEWIGACHGYLVEHWPQSTPAQLIKLVETQLLSSDLSTSTLHSAALIPAALPNVTATLFPFPKNAVLVQIISITEIAQSALGLLEVLKEKKELERLRIKNEEMGDQKPVAVVDDGEEPVVEGQFGRGMLKFRLSDGVNEIEAIEWARIDGLRLGETQLGCKLLLTKVCISRGILLLDPACVVIKGHTVEEFEDHAAALLEASLKNRLGLPLDAQEPVPAAAPARQEIEKKPLVAKPKAKAAPKAKAPPKPKAAPEPKAAPKAKVVKTAPKQVVEEEDEFGGQDDFDMDEEAERVLLEVERRALDAVTQKKLKSSASQPTPTPIQEAIVEPVASGSQLPPPGPPTPPASVKVVPAVKKPPTKAALKAQATWEEKESLRTRVEAEDQSFLDGLDYEPVEKTPAAPAPKRQKIVLDIDESDEEPVVRKRSARIARGSKKSFGDDMIVLD